jgi:hypothetical protein
MLNTLGGVFVFLIAIGLLASGAIQFAIDGNKAGRQIQNGIDGFKEDPNGSTPAVVIEAPRFESR